MNIVNERVEHIIFGFGVITEIENNKIWVQFQDNIGRKVFLYPEAFEKFLKAVNSAVESNALEECHRKQEQIEEERKEKERVVAEEKEEKVKLGSAQKKLAAKLTKKKS
ncbi:hypothetical protein [Clostridium sp. CF012]|uniref:hypothetical protein n=1 Tax=Clostridium sp. CF012 TaxID=2843319 RepID=UPI001C0BCF2C|nr:hypothetical protein [Clostridium sp. CF012]MBU3142387.1 hypothetical protein [Clostridium sp. CF012]